MGIYRLIARIILPTIHVVRVWNFTQYNLLLASWCTPRLINGPYNNKTCRPRGNCWYYYSDALNLTYLLLDKIADILADDNFGCIFLNENNRVRIRISPKVVPRSSINNTPALFQAMAWHRTGDKPLPEPVLTQFTDVYICGTKGRWDKWSHYNSLTNVSSLRNTWWSSTLTQYTERGVWLLFPVIQLVATRVKCLPIKADSSSIVNEKHKRIEKKQKGYMLKLLPLK